MIISTPAPRANWGRRPTGARPELIVIHGTVGTDDGDLSWLLDPTAGVSYHYLIKRPGAIHQLVGDTDRAWHAGRSRWDGRSDVNDFSIGIGISNLGPRDGNPEPYTDAQYKACGALCATLMARWDIPVEAIVGHYHVSPGRKSDPWEHFEWMRLASYLYPDIGVCA